MELILPTRKLILLTNDVNYELYQELKREYISDTYGEYLQLIIYDICQELKIDMSIILNSDFYNELCQVTLLTINKIWLDNIMKYIINSTISNFLMLIQHNQLGQNIFVSRFYSRQITDIFEKHLNISEEELDIITDITTVKLQFIMGDMYINNSARYNIVLMNLIDNILQMVKNICFKFKYYRFELDQYCRPLILYTEKEHNETFYS